MKNPTQRIFGVCRTYYFRRCDRKTRSNPQYCWTAYCGHGPSYKSQRFLISKLGEKEAYDAAVAWRKKHARIDRRSCDDARVGRPILILEWREHGRWIKSQRRFRSKDLAEEHAAIIGASTYRIKKFENGKETMYDPVCNRSATSPRRSSPFGVKGAKRRLFGRR